MLFSSAVAELFSIPRLLRRHPLYKGGRASNFPRLLSGFQLLSTLYFLLLSFPLRGNQKGAFIPKALPRYILVPAGRRTTQNEPGKVIFGYEKANSFKKALVNCISSFLFNSSRSASSIFNLRSWSNYIINYIISKTVSRTISIM